MKAPADQPTDRNGCNEFLLVKDEAVEYSPVTPPIFQLHKEDHPVLYSGACILEVCWKDERGRTSIITSIPLCTVCILLASINKFTTEFSIRTWARLLLVNHPF